MDDSIDIALLQALVFLLLLIIVDVILGLAIARWSHIK